MYLKKKLLDLVCAFSPMLFNTVKWYLLLWIALGLYLIIREFGSGAVLETIKKL